ncbi:UPF0598 protein CG30010, partial [Cryptotermes secundus]
LTYGPEPFLRRSQICSYSGISQHFMEPEGSLPCSQEPLELYDRPNRPETLEVEPEVEVDTEGKGPYILQSGVEKAIKEMRKGKATGDDDVPGDVLKRLRLNTTGRYMEEFPYLSVCGRERNFIRCDDFPVVFTHVIRGTVNGQTEDQLSYGHAGDLLRVKFEPEKIFMLPESGRVYHPAPENVGGVGLVRSKLAIDFSKCFEFDDEHKNPIHFMWNGSKYKLERGWYYEAVQKN